MKTFISVVIAAVLGLGAGAIAARYYTTQPAQPQLVAGFDLGACKITESTVVIGNQLAIQVIATSTSRQWAIIQQPTNATNTVSLAFSGRKAVAGSGYQLNPNNGTLIHASTTDQVALGYSTPFRTESAVSAMTSAGSTTVKVTDCK